MLSEDKLGACVVLHAAKTLAPMLRRLGRLQAQIGEPLEFEVLIASSSSLSPGAVNRNFADAGFSIRSCRNFDDEFFDFSAYRDAGRRFLATGCRGVLFLNDTLISKHDSSYLQSEVSKNIARLRQVDLPFPVMVGPYRHSEFSLGEAGADEFVSTFLFYLNRTGLQFMATMLNQLPEICAGLRDDGASDRLEAPLLRLCKVHALQLSGRYDATTNPQESLTRKLTTAYCERSLSQHVRANGLIWYAAGGLFGRLVEPVQSATNRLISRVKEALGGALR